jgi:hypothetical protein
MNRAVVRFFKLTPWNLQLVVIVVAVNMCLLFSFQFQLIADVIDGPQMPQDCPVEGVVVQAFVWELLAGGTAVFEVSAKPFHQIGPVAPNRTPTLNAVCKVKECVDGEHADWESPQVSLIVYPFAHQHVKTFKVLTEPTGCTLQPN